MFSRSVAAATMLTSGLSVCAVSIASASCASSFVARRPPQRPRYRPVASVPRTRIRSQDGESCCWSRVAVSVSGVMTTTSFRREFFENRFRQVPVTEDENVVFEEVELFVSHASECFRKPLLDCRAQQRPERDGETAVPRTTTDIPNSFACWIYEVTSPYPSSTGRDQCVVEPSVAVERLVKSSRSAYEPAVPYISEPRSAAPAASCAAERSIGRSNRRRFSTLPGAK